MEGGTGRSAALGRPGQLCGQSVGSTCPAQPSPELEGINIYLGSGGWFETCQSVAQTKLSIIQYVKVTQKLYGELAD